MGLNPGFTNKLDGKDGPLDDRKLTKIIIQPNRAIPRKVLIFLLIIKETIKLEKSCLSPFKKSVK